MVCAWACRCGARSAAKARSNPAAARRPERARAPARPPVPFPGMAAVTRPPSARHIVGKPGHRKTPDRPRPAAPPSGAGQANAAGEAEEDARRSLRSETGSPIPATLRRAQAHARRPCAGTEPSISHCAANARLLTAPGKAHLQPPIIARDNCRFHVQNGSACREGSETGRCYSNPPLHGSVAIAPSAGIRLGSAGIWRAPAYPASARLPAFGAGSRFGSRAQNARDSGASALRRP